MLKISLNSHKVRLNFRLSDQTFSKKYKINNNLIDNN